MQLNINQKKILKISIVLILLVTSMVLYIIKQAGTGEIVFEHETTDPSEKHEFEYISDELPKEPALLVVDIDGEVNQPSVYILPNGSRLYEAIEAAGGLTDYADTRNTNLASILTDGTKLYIPSKKEVEEEAMLTGNPPGSRFMPNDTSEMQSGAQPGISSSGKGLININIADSAELQKLIGVGPSTAQKIIDYRQEYGGFNKIEDLMNVSGIGEKTFEKLKKSIIVE